MKRFNIFRKKRDSLGIKWKIFLYFLLFCQVLLALLWIYQTLLLERFYKSIKIGELKQCVKQVEAHIHSEDLPEIMREIADQNNVGLMVTDYNFGKIHIAGSGAHSIIPRLRVSEFFLIYERALENGGNAFQSYQVGGTHIRYSQDPRLPAAPHEDFLRGEPSGNEKKAGASQDLLFAKLVDFSDGTQSIIMADTIVTPLDTTVKTLGMQALHISVIMFLFALILAFWAAKVISKPIVKTNNAAKMLARGNYGAVFDGAGYREISQLNETLNYAASELAKVEQLRRELIANVSHDLRTPLTMIVGYGGILRDIPGENTPENAQVIIEEAGRLNSLVSGLLDLSMLQSGMSHLSREVYNLTQSIREILSRYQKLVEKDGYEITFIHTNDVYVNGDRMKITQVVYNLLNNAVNYTGKDRSVTIRQILLQNSVRVEISDSGDGIKKEHLPYIWDRYYKVDQAHRRAVTGTGLGLSIVKSILELHRAKYGVESAAGQGSTFWFELETQ